MILIKNGKFFIEGVETDNPELIGLALMDYLELARPNNKIDDNVFMITVRPLGKIPIENFSLLVNIKNEQLFVSDEKSIEDLRKTCCAILEENKSIIKLKK